MGFDPSNSCHSLSCLADAQPEDSGTWICKQFSGQDLQGSTDARDFIVVGRNCNICVQLFLIPM